MTYLGVNWSIHPGERGESSIRGRECDEVIISVSVVFVTELMLSAAIQFFQV